MNTSKAWAVVRDAACFALGTFILVAQTWTGHADEWLTGAGVVLCIGVPGVTALAALRAGKSAPLPTAEQSSPPAPSSPSR